MMQSDTLYHLEGVGKFHDSPAGLLEILPSLDLTIMAGESVAIVGASGSGKSTLLHLLGALDVPSKGKLFFEGCDLATLSSDEKAHIRNRKLGFVFQFHNLLPEFSAAENVAMQAIISGMPRNDAIKLAYTALDTVGLSDRCDAKVTTMSGGERQRVAIARAILLRPKVLLADEPTGNLDEKTGETIGKLLLELNRELGMTLVVVTHNRELAELMTRRLELRAGELYDQSC
ncbi:MAG: ABC transporter ATP-binding protein [Pseudomonadota bacterium]